MTDDDGHYETKKSNISEDAGGRSLPEIFCEFRGDFENFLCNFIYRILYTTIFWGGLAPPPEKFCEFRGVFEDFCIRFLIM